MSDIADKIYAATGLTLGAEAAAAIGQMIQVENEKLRAKQADRIAELEKALKRWIEADDGGDGHECIHALSDARKLVEGKKDE